MILLISPRTFDHGGVEDFLPSVETLNISSIIEKGGNSFPVFGSVLIYEFSEFFIL
jgi:hypothetical protein